MVIIILLYMAREVIYFEDLKLIMIFMYGFEIFWSKTFFDYRFSYTITYFI